MKVQSSTICILALVTISGVNAVQDKVTPVQKVITLLSGMLEKGKEEKHQEQLMYAESKQYCDDEQAVTSAAITEEEHTIDSLTAMIAKDAATAAHLLQLISQLSANEDVWSGDIKAAKKVREIEAADYQETHKDYSESITALQHAIEVLKAQAHDRKQKASLAQVATLNLIPEKAKKAIDIFLQQGEDSLDDEVDAGAPEANAYEFQSSGINDILEKLLDKFIDERTSIEKEEANSKNAYQMLLQELKTEIEQAIDRRGEKKVERGDVLESKALESGDKTSEEALEVRDEASLKDLVAMCEMDAQDFEARQTLRAEELATIENALEILQSDSVSGMADKHLPALMQKKGASFTQLRSDANSNTRLQDRIVQFLQSRAKSLNSRVLSALVRHASSGPFDKVKKMIKDLIVRLMEEANEESEHKGWCDTELSTNEQTRKQKTEEVEKLHATIDELTASINKLNGHINDLTKAVAGLDGAVAEATKIRNAEKKKADETIEDASEAQTALAQANTVLKEFYAKAGEATSFAQVNKKSKVEPYKGMQEANGGIIGMLEVIESDFARLESETKAGEVSAQKEYDRMMSDSAEDKAVKSKDIEHKQAKKQDQEQALTSKKADLEGTQKELDAALSYFDKLKPSCVDAGVSYEDRVARRKEEISSLQEALRVMNGEDLA